MDGLAEALAAHALSLPEAWDDFPWGERVAKVRKKVFVFLGMGVDEKGEWGFSVKLPTSSARVLEEPYAKPTGYGLGKAGGVSISLGPTADGPSLSQMKAWVEESYRAVAPKTLVKKLDARS